MAEKFWMGSKPTRCECDCGRELKEQFVDGRTIYGSWGIFGVTCYKRIGVGYGLGKGQRYDLKTLKKLEG